VTSKESSNGTAIIPRVNREEFIRVRKARILLHSMGKSFKRNGSVLCYWCDWVRVELVFSQISAKLAS
jgi:hypothetical protein